MSCRHSVSQPHPSKVKSDVVQAFRNERHPSRWCENVTTDEAPRRSHKTSLTGRSFAVQPQLAAVSYSQRQSHFSVASAGSL